MLVSRVTASVQWERACIMRRRRTVSKGYAIMFAAAVAVCARHKSPSVRERRQCTATSIPGHQQSTGLR